MKVYALGDIHGNAKGLKQCLERSNFDYENDKLIFLGDICDGIVEVRECFDELLKIKNLVMILGNHDDWALEWYDRDQMYRGNPYVEPERLWTTQGGEMTLKSYGYKDMPEEHLNLLKSAKLYHIEKDDDEEILFTHGGINPNQRDMTKQDRNTFLWDRDLIHYARKKHNKNPNYKWAGFKNIFVGHTTTQYYDSLDPIRSCNVVMLDTGGGWNGKITIMEVATGEYWQSDFVKDLYPEYMGR